MVAAATIVSMAAADGERISIFPLGCPNKARRVSFSAPDIYFVKGRSLVITVDVAVDPSFLVIRCRKYSPSRWLQQTVTMVATDVPGGVTRVARQFWRTCLADNSRNMFWIFLKLSCNTLKLESSLNLDNHGLSQLIKYPHNETFCQFGIPGVIFKVIFKVRVLNFDTFGPLSMFLGVSDAFAWLSNISIFDKL